MKLLRYHEEIVFAGIHIIKAFYIIAYIIYLWKYQKNVGIVYRFFLVKQKYCVKIKFILFLL